MVGGSDCYASYARCCECCRPMIFYQRVLAGGCCHSQQPGGTSVLLGLRKGTEPWQWATRRSIMHGSASAGDCFTGPSGTCACIRLLGHGVRHSRQQAMLTCHHYQAVLAPHAGPSSECVKSLTTLNAAGTGLPVSAAAAQHRPAVPSAYAQHPERLIPAFKDCIMV